MRLHALVSALAIAAACGPAPSQPSSSEPVVPASPADAAKPASPVTPAPVVEPAPPVDPAPPATPTPAAEPVAPSADAPAAKSGAPVTMKVKFPTDQLASLDVVFSADGKDVKIEVYGVDGLTVTKPKTAPALGVRAGETVAIAVEFTAPADRDSNLAVRVSGMFAGTKQSRVQSFTVRAKEPAAKQPSEPPVTDKQGRKLKVMTPKPK